MQTVAPSDSVVPRPQTSTARVPLAKTTNRPSSIGPDWSTKTVCVTESSRLLRRITMGAEALYTS